jgi:hypothetical protein
VQHAHSSLFREFKNHDQVRIHPLAFPFEFEELRTMLDGLGVWYDAARLREVVAGGATNGREEDKARAAGRAEGGGQGGWDEAEIRREFNRQLFRARMLDKSGAAGALEEAFEGMDEEGRRECRKEYLPEFRERSGGSQMDVTGGWENALFTISGANVSDVNSP